MNNTQPTMTNEQPLNQITAALAQHIDSHQTAGHTWPDSAEFAVVFSHTTWPLGWDKESDVKFFDSRKELDAWIARKKDWAMLEDNDYAFQAYKWDLGPELMEGLCHNTSHLRMTYEQKVKAGIIAQH